MWAFQKRTSLPLDVIPKAIEKKKAEYETVNRKIVRIEIDEEGVFVNARNPSQAYLVDVRQPVLLSLDLPLIHFDQPELLYLSRM